MKKILFLLFFSVPIFLMGQTKFEMVGSLDYSILRDTIFLVTEESNKSMLNYHFNVNGFSRLHKSLWIKYGIGFTRLGFKNSFSRQNQFYLEAPIALRLYCSKKKITPLFEFGFIPRYYLQSYNSIKTEKQFYRNSEIRNFNLAYSVAIGIRYMVNKNLDITIQPNFQSRLTKIGNFPYAPNYHKSIGIGLGIIYNFKKK